MIVILSEVVKGFAFFFGNVAIYVFGLAMTFMRGPP